MEREAREVLARRRETKARQKPGSSAARRLRQQTYFTNTDTYIQGTEKLHRMVRRRCKPFYFILFQLGPDIRLFHLRFHHAARVHTPFCPSCPIVRRCFVVTFDNFPIRCIYHADEGCKAAKALCRPSDCRVLGLSEAFDITKLRFFTLTYTGDAAFVL